MNLNLPDRQKWLVIIAGTVVGLFMLDRVLFTPLTNKWTEHSKDIARLQTLVTEGRTTIARAAQTERTWAEMQSNSLPKDPAQAEQDVLSSFYRWGQANRIELSIRPQWKRGATDKYSLLECRVDGVGTLATISKFLFDVEQSPLALRVDSVELTSRDDSGSKLSLGLVVSGLRLAPLERDRK